VGSSPTSRIMPKYPIVRMDYDKFSYGDVCEYQGDIYIMTAPETSSTYAMLLIQGSCRYAYQHYEMIQCDIYQ
jgi:hypothetical protein